MPYDGLFLPYEEEWANLGPINGGLAQYNVTFDMMDRYYEKIQQAGFHSLSYFDIGNFGTRINIHALLEKARLDEEERVFTRTTANLTLARASTAMGSDSSSSDGSNGSDGSDGKDAAGCGVRPNGMPGPCWAPETTASSAYLEKYLMKALLVKGWSLRGGEHERSCREELPRAICRFVLHKSHELHILHKLTIKHDALLLTTAHVCTARFCGQV
jgi:hypothetical protein